MIRHRILDLSITRQKLIIQKNGLPDLDHLVAMTGLILIAGSNNSALKFYLNPY